MGFARIFEVFSVSNRLTPPRGCDIINITVTSSDKEEAQRVSAKIAMQMRVALRGYADCVFYGPAPAPIGKIQGRYRVRLWLKCRADEEFVKILRGIIHQKGERRRSDLYVAADINPYSMS